MRAKYKAAKTLQRTYTDNCERLSLIHSSHKKERYLYTMTLALSNREMQCRLSSTEDDADKPIPDIDRRILELLRESPIKRANPCEEKFVLYQITMDVYDAACSGGVLSHNGIQLLQNHNKRQVYDLLFNAISRKSLIMISLPLKLLSVC